MHEMLISKQSCLRNTTNSTNHQRVIRQPNNVQVYSNQATDDVRLKLHQANNNIQVIYS